MAAHPYMAKSLRNWQVFEIFSLQQHTSVYSYNKFRSDPRWTLLTISKGGSILLVLMLLLTCKGSSRGISVTREAWTREEIRCPATTKFWLPVRVLSPKGSRESLWCTDNSRSPMSPCLVWLVWLLWGLVGPSTYERATTASTSSLDRA